MSETPQKGYLHRIIAARDKNPFLFAAGSVSDLCIQHSQWCLLKRGKGNCNCFPDITVTTVHGKFSVNHAGECVKLGNWAEATPTIIDPRNHTVKKENYIQSVDGPMGSRFRFAEDAPAEAILAQWGIDMAELEGMTAANLKPGYGVRMAKEYRPSPEAWVLAIHYRGFESSPDSLHPNGFQVMEVTGITDDNEATVKARARLCVKAMGDFFKTVSG